MQKKYYDVAVLGDWHLAFVIAGSLASRGVKTLFVNTGKESGKELPKPPVEEPGLQNLLTEALRSGYLDYSNNFPKEKVARFAWLAIDTPVNEQDDIDTTSLEKTVGEFPSDQWVISSQVPMGFCDRLERKYSVEVCYLPENLRLGKGIETFLKADRTVLGAREEKFRQEMKSFLGFLETEFILCDLPTAEMIKHATNAFLATSISFSNEFARIGEKFGVDSQMVGRALKMDKRIGKQAYVMPGLGFAGGTLPRDLRVLQKLGRENEVPTPLVDAVLSINEATSRVIFDSIRDYVKELRGKTILILGYTYKAETDALRRSLSIELSKLLKKADATVWGFDPMLNGSDLRVFEGSLKHFEQWKDIPEAPDVAVVMTPRPAFAELTWSGWKASNKRKLLLDTRGCLSKENILREGFDYKSLWQPIEGSR